jgi:hypothetical protein
MTPTLQASDLNVEGLVRDLPALREEAESFAKAAHAGVTDLAALVSLLLAEVDTATAQLAAEKARADKAEGERDNLLDVGMAHFARAEAAEANLAAANKQIEEMLDGNRPLPFSRDELGRMVREAWVRWAGSQPNPKASWLVAYENLSREDQEADCQIGESLSRWTLIGDSARTALSREVRNG